MRLHLLHLSMYTAYVAAFNAKSEDLGAMVDFLYSGKANIHQENFDSFMTLAKDLQLKGLWGDFLNDDDISYSDVENETRERTRYHQIAL